MLSKSTMTMNSKADAARQRLNAKLVEKDMEEKKEKAGLEKEEME
jgi:hypothetical protein